MRDDQAEQFASEVVANIRRVDPERPRSVNEARSPQRPGSLPPPAHTGGHHSADEEPVFLSPRVLDQSAFDALGSELRSLLSEVRSESASLKRAADAAAKAKKELAEAATKQRDQLELAAKLAKALNARGEQVERSITDLETRLMSIDERASSLEASTSAQVAHLEEKAAEHIARVDEHREAAAADLKHRSDEAYERFAATRDKAQTMLHQAGEKRVTKVRDSVTAVLAQVEAMRDQFRTEFETATGGARATLEAMIERAERLTGEREDQDGSRSLADVVDEAATLQGAVMDIAGRLGKVRASAEDSTRELEDRLAESKMLLDLAGSRQEKAAEALNETIEVVEQAEQRLTEQAVETKEALRPIESARDEARAEAARLAQLRQEASQIVEVSREAAEQARTLMVDVRDAATRLEPWRELLLGRDLAEDELPEPLQRIIETFRGGISRDLSKMAAAMSLVARQAESMMVIEPASAGPPEPAASTVQPSVKPVKTRATRASKAKQAVSETMTGPSEGSIDND
ncbi:MAG: hypothetical protein AAGI30_10385 [Planctomycetota bacterium]